MIRRIEPKRLSGFISVPPSKSDAQRAFLAAALANGSSRITGYGTSDDELAMLRSIQQMGATVREKDSVLEITGINHFPEKIMLSAGESGLGVRLLTAVCAAFDAEVTIQGEGSLVNRPLHFFEEVLPQLGVSIQTNGGKVPVKIIGPSHGANLVVDGSLSSQFISGLLMSLPLAKGNSTLTVEQLTSAPYVQMTLETVKAFGIGITHEQLERFEIAGNQKYSPCDYQIDADWSSASYWLVAAAIGHPVVVQGLRLSSFQADKNMLNALMSAGCKIIHSSDGIHIDGTHKVPFEFDATNCPDLFPALVTLAASISGVSHIKGANRLEYKESHRGLALKEEFEKLGLSIELKDNVMRIVGTGKLTGGSVCSHHDHRIAMCLAIAATLADDIIEIADAEAVSKSYPQFWEDVARLQTH
jgi:3-phosphoshikimate 1-carboxyvinyltransferase